MIDGGDNCDPSQGLLGMEVSDRMDFDELIQRNVFSGKRCTFVIWRFELENDIEFEGLGPSRRCQRGATDQQMIDQLCKERSL